MQLPPHASQLRGIFELNSPRRIYDEWMNLSEGFSAPTVNPPKKYPSPDELDSMFADMSNKTISAIRSPTIQPQDLRSEIFKCAQMINTILDNYSNLVNLSVITSHLRGPNSGRMQQALNALETGTANAVVILNQFTSHVEILANPRIPVRNHWDILAKIHSINFAFLKDYVNRLRGLFKVVSYDHVMNEIGDKSSISSLPYGQNRPAMASFGPQYVITPSASQPYIAPSTIPSAPSPSQPAVQEDPQIAALHTACSQLLAFSQDLTRNGYTWKVVIVSPQIQNQCRSLAQDIFDKMKIVEDMLDHYYSLSPNDKARATHLPEAQVNDVTAQMRGNLNILRMLTTKFTLGKVYELCNSFIKQIALIIRELRGSFFSQSSATYNQPYNPPQQPYNQPPPPQQIYGQQPMYEPPPYNPPPQDPQQYQPYGQPQYIPPQQGYSQQNPVPAQKPQYKLKSSAQYRRDLSNEVAEYPDVDDL